MPFGAPRPNVSGYTHHPVSNTKIIDQDSIYTNNFFCPVARYVHLVVSAIYGGEFPVFSRFVRKTRFADEISFQNT